MRSPKSRLSLFTPFAAVFFFSLIKFVNNLTRHARKFIKLSPKPEMERDDRALGSLVFPLMVKILSATLKINFTY